MGTNVAALAAVLLAHASAATALPAGDHAITFGRAPAARAYLLHVPAKVGPQPPLILNFHAAGSSASQQQELSRLDAAADKEGFVVAYPEGTDVLEGKLQTWNAGGCCGGAVRDQVDDVGFVRRLLEDLARRQAYDPARVYATGMANGAMFAYRLAAQLSDRIAAIAPVAGTIAVEHFPTSRAVPVLHFHSVNDPAFPYAGGPGAPLPMTNFRITHLGVEAGLADWAKANGCATPIEQRDRKEARGHTATLLAYPKCRAEVLAWKLTGAGHAWPGGDPNKVPKELGPATSVIDANAEMLRFFSRHRLPQ